MKYYKYQFKNMIRLENSKPSTIEKMTDFQINLLNHITLKHKNCHKMNSMNNESKIIITIVVMNALDIGKMVIDHNVIRDHMIARINIMMIDSSKEEIDTQLHRKDINNTKGDNSTNKINNILDNMIGIIATKMIKLNHTNTVNKLMANRNVTIINKQAAMLEMLKSQIFRFISKISN